MLINIGDVVNGVLVSAIGAAAHIVGRPRTSRRTADELSIAGWADIEALTRDVLGAATFELPVFTDADAAHLKAVLNRTEVQSALQALLAARLTDAPDKDAITARDAVRLALGGIPYARELSDYYDLRISDLVARLEGRVGLAGLSQIRSEAFSGRIIAILNKIELQLVALAHTDHGGQAETRFLDSYIHHVRELHGKLEPPDFERRRKVPVSKIYVNTSVHAYSDQGADVSAVSELYVMDLAKSIDRTVLLGNPGGGKTTAANVLANYFASSPSRKIPFLVTLRDYAAVDPPQRSVVGHIEHNLSTKYQCPAPEGLVDRLLLTGRAIVIFDGLDELLNTYRRRDISNRVEQFCVEYPLTSVLVTSRLVGYDQARLDGSQFTTYRLGEFSEDEVAEYASKWFAVQEGAVPATAEAEARSFLIESESARDLRSNPLLLSLMCILYRGEGSLPRDRTGIYAKCAELLLRKWDEMRRIHRELRDGHLVEPAIWYLAWWLFTREDPQVAVTEGQLIDEIASFLRKRGFESVEQAQATAREFAESCSGRMWVLSDTGTAANGEKLYSFTHRTFLEYFTAVHLATVSDTPEDLAHSLVPRLCKGEWEIVSQLAIQIKDRSSDRGSDRIYAALLEPDVCASSGLSDEGIPKGRGRLLAFLARSLESVEPSPASVRKLTAAALKYLFDLGMNYDSSIPLRDLLSYSVRRDELIADELNNNVAAMISSGISISRTRSLRLLLELPWVSRISARSFWAHWAREQAQIHKREINLKAATDSWFMTTGLYADTISVEQALAMTDSLRPLMLGAENSYTDVPILPYSLHLVGTLLVDRFAALDQSTAAVSGLAIVGRRLISHPDLPWIPFSRTNVLSLQSYEGFIRRIHAAGTRLPADLDEVTCLGLVSSIYICAEMAKAKRREAIFRSLLNLPLPAQFRPMLRNWADGNVNFIEMRAL